jgi:hypothetical protein
VPVISDLISMRAMTVLGAKNWNSGKLRGEYSMASCAARRRGIPVKIRKSFVFSGS